MKWAKQGENLAITNTVPAYKVARFSFDRADYRYRASFKGEFIGVVTKTPKEAQKICERHHTINKEAQEL